jgi:hypothetical protein
VGLKPTTPVFKQAKRVHALDCAATVISKDDQLMQIYLIIKLVYLSYNLSLSYSYHMKPVYFVVITFYFVGTLAPPLRMSSNNDTIDLVFVTYWIHPMTEAQLVLGKDKECLEKKQTEIDNANGKLTENMFIVFIIKAKSGIRKLR